MPVYFIADGDAVKIGISTDPLRRLAALQCANPRPLELLAVVEGGAEDEARLHRTLERDRLRGEWFRRSEHLDELIDEARGLAPLPGTFEEMRQRDPRLDRLAVEAAAVALRDVFCREFSYQRRFAPRLERLAGWGNRTGPLRSRAEWTVATEGLRKLLPECRGCPCDIRLCA